MIPVKVRQVSPTELRIEWDDGHVGRYTMQTLRDNCPCASCRIEREEAEGTMTLPVLTPGKYDLRGVEPVGSYALQISWGDGHRTGIYTYEYLRQLCECENCVDATAHQ